MPHMPVLSKREEIKTIFEPAFYRGTEKSRATSFMHCRMLTGVSPLGSVLMEEESERKINPENPQNHEDEQRKEEPSAKPSSERRPDAPKGLRGPSGC